MQQSCLTILFINTVFLAGYSRLININWLNDVKIRGYWFLWKCYYFTLGANCFQIPPLIGWFDKLIDTFIDSLIHWFMFRYMAIGTYVGAATVELIDSLIE